MLSLWDSFVLLYTCFLQLQAKNCVSLGMQHTYEEEEEELSRQQAFKVTGCIFIIRATQTPTVRKQARSRRSLATQFLGAQRG